MKFLRNNRKPISVFLAILILILYGFYCHGISVMNAKLESEQENTNDDILEDEIVDNYVYGDEDTNRFVVLQLNSLMRFSLSDEAEVVNGYKKFSFVTDIEDVKIEPANYDLYLRVSKNTFAECSADTGSFNLKILDNDGTSVISSNYFEYASDGFDIEGKEGFYRITTLSTYENADNWTFDFYADNNEECDVDAIFNAEVLLVDTNKSLYSERLLINALLEDNGGKDLIDNKSMISLGSYEELNIGVHTSVDNDGTTYYTRGSKANNYVLLNDTYYNIVRVNGNNTIRLMYSQVNEENDFYGTYEEVTDLIKQWRDSNFLNSDVVVSGDFCLNNYTIDNYDLLCNEEYVNDLDVGLISVNEMILMGKEIKLDEEYTNSDTDNSNYWISGYESDYYILDNNKTIYKTNKEEENYALPIINIENVTVSGTGTYSDPYIVK